MMKKFLPYFLFLFTLGVTEVNGQMNYTVSFPSSTYTALTSATTPTLTMCDVAADGAPTSDEGAANNITLPFTFKFNNVDYTKINLCTNGFVTLGTASKNPAIDSFSANYFNSLAFGPFKTDGSDATNRPIIAPLWDDLDLQADANLSYKTTGTAPNRVFTVQWANAKWTWFATAAAINIQLRLYETTNVIEFIYKQGSGTIASGSASIGLADTATSVGNFLSMSGVTSAATASFKTETSNIATKPANNFCMRFTPVTPPAIDASVTDLTAPSAFVSCYNTNKDVSLILRNKGTSNIAAGAATVNLRVVGANAQVLSKTNTKLLTPGASEVVSFSLNLSNPTTTADNISAIVSLASDTRAINDTSTRTSNTADTYSGNFPISDAGDFSLFNWLKTINGSNFWTFRSSPYFASPYFTTGPTYAGLGDSIRGTNDNNFYMFVPRATAGQSSGYIYSNCIPLPNTGNPLDYNFSFFMTHDSSRPKPLQNANGVFISITDTLYVVVSNDNGQTWKRVGNGVPRVIAGYDVPTYQQDSVSLAAYAGQTIQVGLEGVGYFGNFFGVDDISLGNAALPVKFNAFAGYREGTKNILDWSTFNELNNKGFDVQRSVNGKDFTSIAFVNSKAVNGNSSATISYKLTDEKPLTGDNYYRLRQVDINGKENFSSIVLIKAPAKSEITKLYPNPATDNMNVVFNATTSEKVIIKITDMSGRTVEVRNVETMIGDNNYNFNVSKLAKGNYNVKVTTLNNVEIATQKFVKM